jgi:D-threo-aldose 1-dehydrogenase
MNKKPKNKRLSLGSTGLSVNPIGFGCAPIGLSMFGELTETQAVEVIQQAFQQGINLFDTAPSYGNGLSEYRLGKALKGITRQEFIIETKLGVVRENRILRYHQPPGNVRRSLEESLERLQFDYVDILLIHDPDQEYADAIGNVYPELARLREEGIVKAIGVGMNHWEMLADFMRDADFNVFMLAHRYTLLEQNSLSFLDKCFQKGIGIHLAGVFQSGILATGAVENARFIYRDAPDEICDRVSNLQTICARYNVPLSAAALQFAWAHPAVTSLVIGMSYPEEVYDNLGAFHLPIPGDFWKDLQSERLIDENAPIP